MSSASYVAALDRLPPCDQPSGDPTIFSDHPSGISDPSVAAAGGSEPDLGDVPSANASSSAPKGQKVYVPGTLTRVLQEHTEAYNEAFKAEMRANGFMYIGGVMVRIPSLQSVISAGGGVGAAGAANETESPMPTEVADAEWTQLAAGGRIRSCSPLPPLHGAPGMAQPKPADCGRGPSRRGR